MNGLPVYFEQRRVGTIDVNSKGPSFAYDSNWIGLRGAFPISITMPLKPERISPDLFLPWAANLLPESDQLRTLGQLLGMARNDVVGLLSAIGGDTAGALSIGQPGRTASFQWRPIDKPEDLERMIEQLQIMESSLDDSLRYKEADFALHSAIHVAAHNLVVSSVLRVVHELLRTSRMYTGMESSALAKALEQHRVTIDAIVAGDPEAAREAMKTHIAWTREMAGLYPA